jgi:hypothetical protein
LAIERIEYPDGKWEEKANDPKGARELFEKHAPALQQHGVNEFQRKWKEQEAVGFERVREPNGQETYVRADEVQTRLASGYKPLNLPRTVVPFLPWQSDRRLGERYDDYIRRKNGNHSTEP